MQERSHFSQHSPVSMWMKWKKKLNLIEQGVISEEASRPSRRCASLPSCLYHMSLSADLYLSGILIKYVGGTLARLTRAPNPFSPFSPHNPAFGGISVIDEH